MTAARLIALARHRAARRRRPRLRSRRRRVLAPPPLVAPSSSRRTSPAPTPGACGPVGATSRGTAARGPPTGRPRAGSTATAAAAGIPVPAVRAYATAQLAEPTGCDVGWTTLAGIGWVESQHGTIDGRTLGADGHSSDADPRPGARRQGQVRRHPGDPERHDLARRPGLGPRGRPAAVHPVDLGDLGRRRRRRRRRRPQRPRRRGVRRRALPVRRRPRPDHRRRLGRRGLLATTTRSPTSTPCTPRPRRTPTAPPEA